MIARCAFALVALVGNAGLSVGQPLTDPIKINFQTWRINVPDGWLADTGEVFGVREGTGYRYGWDADHGRYGPHDSTRLRPGFQPIVDRTLVIMDRYDQHQGASTWSIDVGPGRYFVQIRYIDPSHPFSTNDCMLNGQSASMGTLQRGQPATYENRNVIVSENGEYANRIYFQGQYSGPPTEGCDSIAWIQIQKYGTWAPSSSPSAAPTAWYQQPGHLENLTEVQQAFIQVSEVVDSLGRTVESMRIQMSTQQETVAQLAANLNPAVQSLQNNVTELRSNIANVSGQVNSLQQSIRDAVAAAPVAAASGSTTQGNTPAVEAQGQNVVISSPGGGVRIETSQCGAFDPCDLLRAFRQLQ